MSLLPVLPAYRREPNDINANHLRHAFELDGCNSATGRGAGISKADKFRQAYSHIISAMLVSAVDYYCKGGVLGYKLYFSEPNIRCNNLLP